MKIFIFIVSVLVNQKITSFTPHTILGWKVGTSENVRYTDTSLRWGLTRIATNSYHGVQCACASLTVLKASAKLPCRQKRSAKYVFTGQVHVCHMWGVGVWSPKIIDRFVASCSNKTRTSKRLITVVTCCLHGHFVARCVQLFMWQERRFLLPPQ